MSKIKTAEELTVDNLICRHYAGSRSYGTSLPTSDVDIRGLFVADPIHVRTPFFPIREANLAAEQDTVLYELSQFMDLALKCNPNVIETLWVDQSDVIVDSPAYQMLRAAAPLLLSKKIAFTTSGYALSQLKRIKGHNRWIANPQPERRPQERDHVSMIHNFTTTKILKFNIEDWNEGHRLVPFGHNVFGLYKFEGERRCDQPHRLYDGVGVLITDYDGKVHELPAPLMLVQFHKQQHDEASTVWENYWRWKRERNATRSALEEAHGYDTKHAMHLVRLLRMGAEALETGVVNVRRADAEELLAIRNGKWTYNEVVQYADHMDAHIQQSLYPKSDLRKAPDIKMAARLMLEIQDMMWSRT